MSEQRYEKTCLECGLTFTAKKIDARFCNGTCNNRFYARENREKIRERQRRYQAAHKEETQRAQRRWWDENGEQIRAERRERYVLDSKDPEKLAARQAEKRKQYLENREQILERSKQRTKTQAEQDYAGKKLSAHGTDWDSLFAGLWEAQGGRCYLCGDQLQRDKPRDVHLDHDHTCCPLSRSCERCRRGLACRRCNYLIGLAKDDPDCLRRIADGLEAANKAVRERMRLPRQVRARTRWEMTCKRCDTPFVAYRKDTLYCSKTCMNLAQVERRKPTGPGAPRRVLGIVPCKQCGEVFDKRNGNSLYCSERCRRVVAREQNKATKVSRAARKALEAGIG